MSSPSNTVKMNNGEGSPSITVELWLYYPHSGVLVRLIPRSKPLNEGTWIGFSVKREREKKLNPRNHHILHIALSCAYLDEDGVASSMFIAPFRVRADSLLMHATCTAEVTGCKKTGERRMVHKDSPIKPRALIKGNIIW